MWWLYKTGYWINNWIYWVTHSYTQLQYIHSYSSLQFTTALAESSHCIFTGCLSSNIAGSIRLQLFSEDCCLAWILTRNCLTWDYTRNSRNCNSLLSCQLTNSADCAISYIAGEWIPKKTPLRFPYCWMSSLSERTPKKTPPLLSGCVLCVYPLP
jgi:hypothetical protein